MNYLDEIKAQRANEVHWDNFLMHHGTKGQKWGIRKYQNEDGSLTPAGREHYGYGKSAGKEINSENQKTENDTQVRNQRKDLVNSIRDHDTELYERSLDKAIKTILKHRKLPDDTQNWVDVADEFGYSDDWDQGFENDWNDDEKPTYYIVREKFPGLSDSQLSKKMDELFEDQKKEWDEEKPSNNKKK